MKSSGSLVDTSVWIDFFKGLLPARTLLEKLIAEDTVFTAGPILFELLQGIRSPEERKQVKEAFMATHYLEITPDDWEGAASLAGDLRTIIIGAISGGIGGAIAGVAIVLLVD